MIRVQDIFAPAVAQRARPLIDMLEELLIYDPTKRLTSLQILAAPVFDRFRDPGFELPNGSRMPDGFAVPYPEEYSVPFLIKERSTLRPEPSIVADISG